MAFVSIRYQSRLQFKGHPISRIGVEVKAFQSAINRVFNSKRPLFPCLTTRSTGFNPLSIASSIQRAIGSLFIGVIVMFQSAINRVFNSKGGERQRGAHNRGGVSIRYQSRLQFKVSRERTGFSSKQRFNPLSIASSIQSGGDCLCHYNTPVMFQSAINRVFNSKWVIGGTMATESSVSIRYQSRLQFKAHKAARRARRQRSFNPLSIASSIQSSMRGRSIAITAMFQSAINRVFNSKAMKQAQATTAVPGFNPLSIASSIQREEKCQISSSLTLCFNPLSIASSIQRLHLSLGRANETMFQSAINRVFNSKLVFDWLREFIGPCFNPLSIASSIQRLWCGMDTAPLCISFNPLSIASSIQSHGETSGNEFDGNVSIRYQSRLQFKERAIGGLYFQSLTCPFGLTSQIWPQIRSLNRQKLSRKLFDYQ